MATRKPKSPKQGESLAGEAGVTRVYRHAPRDEPPPTLDAHILAAAQRAVKKPPATQRWAVPLSAAAVVLLSVGVVMLMSEQGALNDRPDIELAGEYPAVVTETPASAPPAAEAEPPVSERLAAGPSKHQLVAPEPRTASEERKRAASPATIEARQQAQTVEPKPDTLTLSRVPAEQPAAAPAVTERDAARAKSTPAKETSRMNVTADVTAVQASGPPGAYQFNVTIKSPDTGCRQYADWWEVVSTDGKLLYRRVLVHSHVGEQPFTRSGGPVPVQPDTVVWVRAHMKPGGYGGVAFQGSVKSGFKQAALDAGFAAGLAKQAPLPAGCDF